MNGISISELTRPDVIAAYEIEKSCLNTAWSKQSIHAFLQKEDAVYLVATFGIEVVGIAAMYVVAGEGQVMNIAVAPSYRQRKVGRQLLEKLMETGIKKGAAFFALEVAEKNLAAVKLYKSMGFYEVGRRKGYYKNDNALLLKKQGDGSCA